MPSTPEAVKGNSISRRAFLGTASVTAAALLGTRRWADAEPTATAPAEGFRFVHLTDIHVEPELKAGEGFRKCMTAVHELKPRPDFILTGGDLVMDSLQREFERVKTLWDLYTGICKDTDIPIHQCIGNHDVFGWGPKKKVQPDHPLYGKKMVQDRLHLEKTTYGFDHKGWHFCVVDDILPHAEAGYEAGLTEEDLNWLENDLKQASTKPKVICVHIPIISVAVFRGVNAAAADSQINVSKSQVCRNPGPILNVLREQSVNLVLSGHLHQNETIVYDKTTHIEDGAVCGAWWKGPHLGNPEGFGVIDVKPDGTFEHRYETYGWQAVQEKSEKAG